MKSKLKWVSGVLGAVLALSLVFGAGVYASQWLSFTGKEQIEQSESNVDEIMRILEDVNSKKITAEQALKELQDLNLEEQNTELLKQVEQLKTDNGILTTEVANQKQQVINKQNEVNNKQAEIEQKQQEIQEKIEEGNRKVADKQAELDGVAQQRDEHKRVAEELQQQINQNGEYVEHLERELQRANEAAQSVSNKTTEAVEKARTYEE